MAIQWFPGHMNKALKAIKARMKSIDAVIEIVDARAPGSSSGPLIDALAGSKPRIKLLNKKDLADPARVGAWVARFESEALLAGRSLTPDGPAYFRAMAVGAKDPKDKQRIVKAVQRALPNRGSIDKPIRAMVCGAPNVGKSSLINALIGKRSAKVANEPGVTRAEQRLMVSDAFWLYDTPGMLWKKIILPESGYRLAQIGSVGYKAYHSVEVAARLAEFLAADYPDALASAFGLQEAARGRSEEKKAGRLPADLSYPAAPVLEALPVDALGLDAYDYLELIALKRKALLKGGAPDVEKAADVLLRAFRMGALGRIGLETPAQFDGWLKRLEESKKSENGLGAGVQRLGVDGEELDGPGTRPSPRPGRSGGAPCALRGGAPKTTRSRCSGKARKRR